LTGDEFDDQENGVPQQKELLDPESNPEM